MRISIIYTSNGPFKVFIDNKVALQEYERLRDLDDFVDYSVIEMPVDDRFPNNTVADRCSCSDKDRCACYFSGKLKCLNCQKPVVEHD